MNYNDHSKLKDQHAFLGASKYHWVNYSPEQLMALYISTMAKTKGTELHAYAAQSISLGQKLPKSQKTLNSYVNDAIGYRMKPEQVLYYSDNCFGTADAISSIDSVLKTNLLRIHDLKTGIGKTHMEQLMIYAALFCLEYRMKPQSISIELRIYQNDTIEYLNPDPQEILAIMDKIVVFDKLITKCKEQEN